MPAPKNPSGGRRRTLAQMAKDALAAQLYLQGYQVREVAEELGYRGPAGAHAAIGRGIRDLGQWNLPREGWLTFVIATLHLLRREFFDIARGTYYLSAPSGKIVMLWDEEKGREMPVPDPGPKHRALAEIAKLTLQLGMFQDLKPATKSRVEHISQDDVDAEIERLVKELPGNDEAPDRRVARKPRAPRQAP